MSTKLEYLVRDCGLFTRSQNAVLLNIASRIGRNTCAWPSLERIARDTRLSRRTVIRAVNELEARDVLVVERIIGRQSRYSIKTEALVSASAREHLVRSQKQRRDRRSGERRVNARSHQPVTSGPASSDVVSPRIINNDKAKSKDGPSDTELLDLLEARDGNDTEWAFEKGVRANGFVLLLECLTRHGRPLFRILIDPSRISRVGPSGLFIVCFDKVLAKHVELPLALSAMGFDDDAHWPIDAFRARMSAPGLAEILPAPAARLGEARETR